jgi:2-phosphosulfolactate phosphatase
VKKIDIKWYDEGARQARKDGKQIVVIDILRATTFEVHALNLGAKAIVPVKDIREALMLKKVYKESLTAGEVGGEPIPGFDLDPSPSNLEKQKVEGKVIIHKSTCGTKCIVDSGKDAIIGSLLNARSIGEYLPKVDKDVAIVASGNSCREFSLEDFLGAGAIIYYSSMEHTDQARAAYLAFKNSYDNLKEIIMSGKNGSKLMKKGLMKDIELASSLNTANVIPIYDQKVVTALKL